MLSQLMNMVHDASMCQFFGTTMALKLANVRFEIGLRKMNSPDHSMED